jgi:hypothetical protein
MADCLLVRLDLSGGVGVGGEVGQSTPFAAGGLEQAACNADRPSRAPRCSGVDLNVAAEGLNGGTTRRAQGSCTGASIEPRQQPATCLHLRRLVVSLSEPLRQRLQPQTVPWIIQSYISRRVRSPGGRPASSFSHLPIRAGSSASSSCQRWRSVRPDDSHHRPSLPEGTRVSRPDGGFVLWLQLPKPLASRELFEAALKKGVCFVPGDVFSASHRYANCLRVSCVSARGRRPRAAAARRYRNPCRPTRSRQRRAPVQKGVGSRRASQHAPPRRPLPPRPRQALPTRRPA